MKPRALLASLLLTFFGVDPSYAQGPGVSTTNQGWPWGELFYDSVFKTMLTVTNDCDEPRPISIHTGLAPYVVSPANGSTYTIPPGSTDIEITVQTPPAPTSFTLPPPSSSHGIYLDLSGYRIRVHHEGYDACPRSCQEMESFYWISGHIHFDPNAPPPPGPLAVSPCRIWWDTGEKPDDLKRDCTQEIRALASAFRQLLLGSLVEDSAAWDWFPSLDAILSMAAEDLVAMKMRADAQLEDPQLFSRR